MVHVLAKSRTQSGRKDGHAESLESSKRSAVPHFNHQGAVVSIWLHSEELLSSIFVYSLLLDIKMEATDISLVNKKLL